MFTPNMNLNSTQALKNHKKLIENRKVLNHIYQDFYSKLQSIKVPSGLKVELGSGGGFLKKHISKVITSDVIEGEGIDKVFFAEKIPLPNSSVAAFYMLNVFHHIKNPNVALKEMQRCLKKGGKIIMIEPYNTLFASFIYKNFHHENFDPNSGWNVKGKGRMSDSNQALPWIIFVRDKQIFQKQFPNLKIVAITPHTPFSYLLSGGLSKPQLIPLWGYPLIKKLESLVSPLNKYLAMFVTIEIVKTSRDGK